MTITDTTKYPATTDSKLMVWSGRALSALVVLFMSFDAVLKILKPAALAAAMDKTGYPSSSAQGLGLVLAISTVLYAVRKTSVLGAILLTGYLGGAVAENVRMGQGPGAIGFTVLIGVLAWGGLFLRDATLRSLIPLRS